MDKVTQILLDALRQAAADPAEQRLYKSGKLPGLFPSRAGASAEAAARALRDGLLEIVRTDTRARTTVEWARLTPRGVELLHGQESPVRALDELRAALEVTRAGVPAWVAEIRGQLEALGTRLTQEVESVMRRLDALGKRVGEALERAQGLGPHLPQEAAAAVPWGPEAVGYLERRRAGGVANDCPMPELFAAVKEKQPELSLKDFHAGVKRLHDRGLVRLVPFAGNGALPEPEYALLDGSAVHYHVTR
jgi:hypothetical protein